MKKRILAVSESSLKGTGFGVYYHELLKRLHATNKYELCELACYAHPEEQHDIPWKFVANMPYTNDQRSIDQYNSDPLNQFGQWKFEQTCLDFKPDIVFDVRDPWMFEYQQRSPFRKFFHWALMPTVDAIPQDEQWIAQFVDADAVFTYSDWAVDVLKREGNGRIKVHCSAPPAADMSIFKPIKDKKNHKLQFGIADDCIIIGTVMRNQKRKLYPDLIDGFAKYLRTAPPELAKRSYLYMHMKWPDIGWDIPRLIKEAGISQRCMFTYICRKCNHAFPSFFQGARTFCRNCNEKMAGLGDSDKGVSREVLSGIINLFDIYVQMSAFEGFGMPQVEAAACGIPVMAVDYSAMEDVVKKLGGTPIPVLKLVRDSDSHRFFAIPDVDKFSELLTEKLSMPESYRMKEGIQTLKLARKHYSYDKTAEIWEQHFDSVEVRDHATTWNSPAQIHTPNKNIPECSNEAFVKWGLVNIAGCPELVDSCMALRMIRDLDNEFSPPHTGGMYFNEMSLLGVQERGEPFSKDRAIHELLKLAENKNIWEERRVKS